MALPAIRQLLELNLIPRLPQLLLKHQQPGAEVEAAALLPLPLMGSYLAPRFKFLEIFANQYLLTTGGKRVCGFLL